MISDASAQDDDNRNNVPVAAPNEVADVIGLTMQWYFDSISSTVPTAERTEDGVSMPRNDMPTFRIDSQALSGVDAVVGNALMSTRWVDATTNLAKSVEMTARFVGNAATGTARASTISRSSSRTCACTWIPWRATPTRRTGRRRCD